jgi:transcriptional regulator with XRE-family HTH domain
LLYNKIKAIAKEKGISIRKIEEDCGFSQGSMCKWNDISPSWDKVQKVADYLNVKINELISK